MGRAGRIGLPRLLLLLRRGGRIGRLFAPGRLRGPWWLRDPWWLRVPPAGSGRARRFYPPFFWGLVAVRTDRSGNVTAPTGSGRWPAGARGAARRTTRRTR